MLTYITAGYYTLPYKDKCLHFDLSLLFGLMKGKAAQKNFLTIPLSGWVCHIAEEVSGTNYNALIICTDFIHDEEYLSLFCTSVFMWLTSKLWAILM
jgi:hypothetical protein